VLSTVSPVGSGGPPRPHRRSIGDTARCRTASTKTGHRGDHRLWRGVCPIAGFLCYRSGCRWHTGAEPAKASNGASTAPVEAKPAKGVTTDFGVAPAGQTAVAPPSASICAVPPRHHRTRALPRSQRHGDLAGSGRYLAVSRVAIRASSASCASWWAGRPKKPAQV